MKTNLLLNFPFGIILFCCCSCKLYRHRVCLWSIYKCFSNFYYFILSYVAFIIQLKNDKKGKKLVTYFARSLAWFGFVWHAEKMYICSQQTECFSGSCSLFLTLWTYSLRRSTTYCVSLALHDFVKLE